MPVEIGDLTGSSSGSFDATPTEREREGNFFDMCKFFETSTVERRTRIVASRYLLFRRVERDCSSWGSRCKKLKRCGPRKILAIFTAYGHFERSAGALAPHGREWHSIKVTYSSITFALHEIG